ncbi:unnamed protein product [Brachionus calyciflorus]|uniref:Uncharacterized protein n=1 Tax=Brachionus calyciflorus TaxID=104777 RepID=A0A814E3E1_9BILA|nr:unnamed protein product [Brachionus calyciflorus]
MPKILNWKLTQECSSESSLNQYFSTKCTKMTTKRSITCNSCKTSKMSQSFRTCTSKLYRDCPVKFKIECCQKESFYRIFQLNVHKCSEKEILNENGVDNLIRGIEKNCKDAIEKIIYEKNLTKPKKIHIEVTLKQEEYSITQIPSLEKIQNYIKYRQQKIGDVNSMEGVVEYLETLTKKVNTDDDKV